MGVRSGSGRLRIELRTGPCSRSEAAVARSGQLAVSGPGASGERGAIRNSFRCPACLLRALLCLARASGILCPSLAENHYLAGSSFWRAGRVSDAVPCRRHGRTFPGSPRRCRLGVAANRKGVRPGLPGIHFMNRLNFEKMDKKKLESIDDVLYAVAEGRIVRRRKNPLPALLIGVAGAGLAIWSGESC